MLQRKHPHMPPSSRWEKLTLIVHIGRLTGRTSKARVRLSQGVLLFKPDRC
ncbi:MAG: hypothetical protein AVDCRST_MAG93-8391 [uncultured Chloroflexia bacterium]|uniref:Uncharacterized protein n=1 Tax=uncultured Chloroflexia bacterium TaxID=1672391 RepID=A0A6J4MXP8_9CHLR|nr:MAG: hypothetical protein AVDCRST_MAG93-8391 [uncultured Chloroflexia bacterium]